MFGGSLELTRYVQRISGVIDGFANEPPDKRSVDNVAEEIGNLTDNFERGWRNRFHASWRHGEITDYNLEFKGGIQHVASAFHGAYQRLSWFLSGDEHVLAVVSGQPWHLSSKRCSASEPLRHIPARNSSWLARAMRQPENLLNLDGPPRTLLQSNMAQMHLNGLLGIGDVANAEVAEAEFRRIISDGSLLLEQPGEFPEQDRQARFLPTGLRRHLQLQYGFLRRQGALYILVVCDICSFTRSWSIDGKIRQKQLVEALLRLMLVLRDEGSGQMQEETQIISRIWSRDTYFARCARHHGANIDDLVSGLSAGVTELVEEWGIAPGLADRHLGGSEGPSGFHTRTCR